MSFLLGNPLLTILAALALYGAGFLSGWKVDAWKQDAARLSEVKVAQQAQTQAENDAAAARAERDRIANRFEGRLANLRITNRTINNEVRHEVEKTVYGDPNCNLPISGGRLRYTAINAANGTGPAASKPDAAVPANPGSGPGKGNESRGIVPSRPRPDPTVRGVRPEASGVDRLDQGSRDALAALGLGF